MAASTQTLLPLESGDRLTREEFHRRYCARPEIKRAELVSGVVYVTSPMRFSAHDAPTILVSGWLFTYTLTAPGVVQGGGGTIYLDATTEVQPDAFLFWEPAVRPGGIRRRSDDYLEGSPELVVEVAASSVSYDLHDKLEAYRRAGVPEYIVRQIFDGRILWLRLRDGIYVPLEPNAHGINESEVFPGLRLDVAAMLAGDRAGVLAALASGQGRRRKRR